ncbi:oligosaccharide flippase family protein [Paenarthrobacter nitroguajacolicus]|uniref:oligosaccharide flippase family protein n=1 Tax=Paenarthrobacter nitroguajacolicus TaxID=211146 RepID=UPI004053CEAC
MTTATSLRPRAESRERTPGPDVNIAQNSGFLALSAGLVGVVSYACTLLMANMLGTADYTRFAAAAMILGVAGIVANALVPLPLSHVVAVHQEGSDERRNGVAFSVFVSCLAGFAAAIITGGVTLAIATPALAAAVALAAFAIFIVNAPAGWLQGELRFTWYAVSTIGEVVLRLIFSLLVIVMAWGAGGAVLGFVAGCLAPLVVPWSFYRDLRWRPRVLLEKWRWAETSDIASVLCVVSVLVGIDVVVVGFLDNGSVAAAGFQALATIAKGPVYVAAGTALVAFPLLRTPGAKVGEVLGASFASFGQLGVVAFAIIATAPPVMSGLIVPQKYHGSLHLLPWLAASGLGYAVLMVLSTILLAMRAYRRCHIGLACACFLVVGGLWAGWQLNGVTGMAAGSAVGAVTAGVLLAILAGPVLVSANPGKGAGRFVILAFALIAVLAATAQLQPLVWFVLSGISGVTVLAHQRGLLPHRNDFKISRRRQVGRRSKSTGRRSNPESDVTGPFPTWGSRALSSNLTAFIAVVAAAFGVRALGLERGFELWVDEMLYVRLGESVAAGQFPTLPDGPFFLHPPGYFLLEAGVVRIFGVTGEIIEVTLQLRWLNAVMGAVTVGLGFLLVRRLATPTAAWLTAVLLAFEPFILRNNSHAFLETSAMVPGLAGLLLLVSTKHPKSKLQSIVRLATAGLLLGYSILCKDFFFICTVAPVVAAMVWKKTLPWPQGLVVTAFGLLPYVVYLIVVAAHGHFPSWVWAKTNGLVRISGVEKSTGFTSEGSPSILSRLIEQSGHFGTSYILLGLCPVVGLLLCFSYHAGRRLIGLAGLALGTAGAYSALFGTFEEQYGYGVMVAGAIGSVLVVVEVRERYPRTRKTLAVISICYVVLTVALGLRTALTIDNGFVRANDWVQANLPADARISVTNSTGHFAYMHDPRFGIWPSAPLMQQNGVNYILTQSKPTSQGYGYANPSMLAWLKGHATPMITTPGPTNGETTIWYVDAAALDAAAADSVGVPSKDFGTER